MVVCVCFPKGARNFCKPVLTIRELHLCLVLCKMSLQDLNSHNSPFHWMNNCPFNVTRSKCVSYTLTRKDDDCNLIVCEELHMVLKHFSSSMCELSSLVPMVPMQPPPLCNLQKALGDKIKSNLLHSYLQKKQQNKENKNRISNMYLQSNALLWYILAATQHTYCRHYSTLFTLYYNHI